MARSTSLFFTDPGDFEAAVGEHCHAELTVPGRTQFWARMLRIDLARLSLLKMEEWEARIVFLRPSAGRVITLLPWDREPRQAWAGVSLRPQEIITISTVPGVHGRIEGSCHSAAICCSRNHLIRTGRQLIGSKFVVPPGVVRWRPAPNLVKALTTLFRAAVRVTESRPSAPTSPEAARGLEQEVMGALVECLSGSPAKPQRQREHVQMSIMVRFEEIVRLRPDRVPPLADVSIQLGVATRTLRTYCHDHLGIPPARYLRLHRL